MRDLQDVDEGYLAYHAPRFRVLLATCREMLPAHAQRVLDIGPSPFSVLLRRQVPCPVDTLGLEERVDTQGEGVHHHVDLNEPGLLREVLPRFDLIVFAEVLEHLHTSPVLVLSAIAQLLTPEGVLVVQTPNAASLPKRVKLLLGRNPYDMIRADRSNPGHFREYTLREMRRICAEANLRIVAELRRFYFDARYAHHQNGMVSVQPLLGTAKNALYNLLPPFLREGMTIVCRVRPAGETASPPAPPPRA